MRDKTRMVEGKRAEEGLRRRERRGENGVEYREDGKLSNDRTTAGKQWRIHYMLKREEADSRHFLNNVPSGTLVITCDRLSPPTFSIPLC